MKKLIILLFSVMTFNAAISAAGQFKDGVGYIRPGSPFELWIKFTVQENTLVNGTQSPAVDAPLNVPCPLKKGAEVILGEGESITISYKIGSYEATKDFDYMIQSGENKTTKLRIKKGESLDDLSYRGEGFCHVRIKGQIYEDQECVSLSVDKSYLEKYSDLIQEGWVRAQCANGKKVWISYGELEKNKKIRSSPMG